MDAALNVLPTLQCMYYFLIEIEKCYVWQQSVGLTYTTHSVHVQPVFKMYGTYGTESVNTHLY